MFAMRRFTVFGVLSICMAWTSLLPGNAKVFTFSNLDLRCEVPDSWVFRNQNGDLVNVVDIAHQKCFLLRAYKAKLTGSLDDPRYLQAIEPSFFANGYNITNREKVVLQGIKFYKLTMSKDLGKKLLQVSAYLTLANGYGYWIETSEYGANPDDDTELQGIVSSVRFINPPTILSNSPWSFLFAPRDGIAHDQTYLLVYRTVFVLIFLGILSFPILIMVAIGITIYVLVRKKPAPVAPGYYPPPPSR
jgi:hypothetical protein